MVSIDFKNLELPTEIPEIRQQQVKIYNKIAWMGRVIYVI
jgi:hypothetical protein